MISKRRLMFWMKEVLLITSFLFIITIITYCPSFAKDSYKYVLAEIQITNQGLQLVPVSQTMTLKECKKLEKRQNGRICIADIDDKLIIEDITNE